MAEELITIKLKHDREINLVYRKINGEMVSTMTEETFNDIKILLEREYGL